MRLLLKAWLVLLLVATPAWAAHHFPELTGRVVDAAQVLTPATKETLETSLADYERGTTNQVVVATVASLEGDSIENYGYQLGRFWQIGQKGKNNGAILLVAPNERKVRIEVGYGLEPLLTDAASSEIVQGIILPDFRAGHMEQGIVDGTQAMLAVLGGKLVHVADSEQSTPLQSFLSFVIILCFFWFAMRHPFIAAWLLSGQSSRYGSSRMDSSGWGGGGGFSGGGGSFGGGGSSGSW